MIYNKVLFIRAINVMTFSSSDELPQFAGDLVGFIGLCEIARFVELAYTGKTFITGL